MTRSWVKDRTKRVYKCTTCDAERFVTSNTEGPLFIMCFGTCERLTPHTFERVFVKETDKPMWENYRNFIEAIADHLPEFKSYYDEAKTSGGDTFMFYGSEFDTRYAGYVIEHIETSNRTAQKEN